MLITLLKRAISVLFILSFLALPAYSQGRNFSISKTLPSWLIKVDQSAAAKKPKEISDGYYLSLFENQNHAELHENYRHVIRELVSDAGVQNGSEISVTYDPSYQKVIFHQITVWRNHQPLARLDAAKFKILANEKDLSKFIYSGTYDAYTILDDIRKGDQIEFAYTIKGENPVFAEKYVNEFYFEGSSSISLWYTNLIVSPKRQLNFKNFNFNKPPKSFSQNGMQVYEWENKMTATHQSAELEPDWYNSYKPTQVSEYQNWAEVVAWGLKTNTYPALKTPAIDQKIHELQEKAGNNKRKYIELATRFVQDEIRYMGIEIGQYSQRPNSPEQVFKQRYGDCKDKSLLLIYLLNKAHINAYMAYADTYYGKNTNEFLPSPLVFNHAVVVVEYNNVKTWIDPTISFQRGSFESIHFPNYGKALVLKPGNNKLEDVISIPTGKLISDLNFIVGDTSKNATTTLLIKSTYTDNYADRIRSDIAGSGLESLEKSYLEYIIKYYPDAESSKKVQVKDNEATNTFEITESYTIKNFWLKEEKSPFRKYIYFYGDLIQDKIKTFKLKGRTVPLSLEYPVQIEQNIMMLLPFRPSSLNQHQTIETGDYFFDFTSYQRGRQIKLNYAYRSMSDHVSTDNLERYLKDTKEMNELLSYSITFDPSSITTKPNPYTIILALLAFIISGIYFSKVYQKTGATDLEAMANSRRIGGWLIFLTIGLTVGPFRTLINGIQSGVFSQTYWDAIAGQSWKYILLLRSGLVIYAAALTVQITANLLVLFLLYNRRVEFPRAGTYLFLYNIINTLFNIGLNVGLAALAATTADKAVIMKSLADVMGQNILSILVGIVYILYIQRSVRVKQTFVFTYPRSNYEWKLLQHKNERLAAYYKNLGNHSQTENNNDYLSGVKQHED